MNELTPREKRQQRTHQAILEAARQLINEKGSDGLSMRAIAERIEYSPAAIYEYFGSKEEIIGALCEQGHRRMTEYMVRVPTELPFTEYFLRIGLAYLEFAVQNPDFFLLMFTTATIGDLPLGTVADWQQAEAEDTATSFSILVGAIERGVAEGIFHVQPGLGIMEMAFAAWATVHGIAMLRVTHLKLLQADFEMMARQTLAAFGTGLAINSAQSGLQ